MFPDISFQTSFSEQCIFNKVHPSHYCDYFVGAIIQQSEKKKMLSFIKSNFGKLSNRQIAQELRVGSTTINRWCQELGLFIEKNSVNEEFFKVWTSDMAYILGFVFADGNINWNPLKSYRSLTITASEKDKKHLERMRLLMESTKELLYSSKTNSYRLIINNKAICKDLMGFGLTPRKSLSVKFPNIPRKYLRHFLRGVIDGDGNIRYVQREKSPYFEITISSGSKVFLEKMAEEIYSIGIKGKVRKVSSNVYILQYSCKRGLQLAKFIYNKDSNLCLSRKFDQYAVALRAKEVV